MGMISQKMQDALNKQINAEMYSAYLYLSMSAHFSDKNLDGFAGWMKAQAQEEMVHAMKIYSFVIDRDGRVILKTIDGPKTDWGTPLEIFQEALKHEQKVTEMIHNLVSLSMDEKDFASNSFLQWFVDEQVEEESTASGIVDQLKMIGDSKEGLFMMDREMGQRTFNAAAASADAGGAE